MADKKAKEPTEAAEAETLAAGAGEGIGGIARGHDMARGQYIALLRQLAHYRYRGREVASWYQVRGANSEGESQTSVIVAYVDDGNEPMSETFTWPVGIEPELPPPDEVTPPGEEGG